MKALVVGLGSIGKRHAEVLGELGVKVAALTQHPQEPWPCFSDLGEALKSFQPNYVVIANATAQHQASLQALLQAGFTGPILVEKPLFDHPSAWSQADQGQIHVAYNLRFHPILQRVKQLLQGQRVISAQSYVGQYLPGWRPGRDYRQSYSAKKAEGGGALRDLSHELDYLMWMLGDVTRLTAIGGKFSDLEIDSDDLYSFLLQCTHCPALGLEVNYLDRKTQRRLTINCAEGTLVADLVEGLLWHGGIKERFEVPRNHTYLEQHNLLLQGKTQDHCTLTQGLRLLEVIQAAEQVAQAATPQWIEP